MSRRRVNELINGKRAITPDTAVRLAMYFGNEAAFWMHLQVAWDMHSAVREVRAASCVIHQRVMRGTDVLSEARVTAAFVAEGRPKRQPRGWVEIFRRLTEEGD